MVLRRVGVVAFAVVAGFSCGGSSPIEPTPPISLPPTSPTATPTPPAPAGALGCPYGKGTLDTTCGTMTSAYVADVDRAISALAARRSDIFDLNDQRAPGDYKVVKTADYFAGVVQELQGAGFCAESDNTQ